MTSMRVKLKGQKSNGSIEESRATQNPSGINISANVAARRARLYNSSSRIALRLRRANERHAISIRGRRRR